MSRCRSILVFRLPYSQSIGSLKSLQNQQPIERQRLADIFLISQALLNQAFDNEPSPLHFSFQAALSPTK